VTVKTRWIAIALLGSLSACPALGQRNDRARPAYKALKCPAPSIGSTWTIFDRNGANTKVDPYLSSLGNGEGGTGVITSPPFVLAVEKITFTICGHDGQSGGRGENYIALVDARKGNVLAKTPPPQNDAMQPRDWDVSTLGGLELRIEVHDGNDTGAFAWLGVGRIDAGPALRIDFRQGMPKGWSQPAREGHTRDELVTGGVPFNRDANAFSLMPKKGAVDIPCGFRARRLYFLGCTVATFRPLDIYGSIEVHYETGSPDIFPLMGGFTLDGAHKLLSPSKAMHLHPSADPYQHYLVIGPRDRMIEKIRLSARPDPGAIPRITAITCETTAESDHLTALPKIRLKPEEAGWIESHTISSDHTRSLDRIKDEIRRSHRIAVPTPEPRP